MKKSVFALLLTLAMLFVLNPGIQAQNRPQQPAPTGQVRLYIIISCSAENHDKVVDVYRKLIEATKKEEGCIDYDLFEDATDPTRMMLLETWLNTECHQKHNQSEHMKKYFPELRGLCTQTADRVMK